MRDKISFLVLGDSAAGKSAFIRNFGCSGISNWLGITGTGQTTRCNVIYRFPVKDTPNTNVHVHFLLQEEFIDKYIQNIKNKYRIGETFLLDHIKTLINKDLVSDTYILLNEYGLSHNEKTLVFETDLDTVADEPSLIKLLEERLGNLYKLLMNKTESIVSKFPASKPHETLLNFDLGKETADLLTYCMKRVSIDIPEKYSTNLTSISGLVKKVDISLPLQQEYSDLCVKIGLNRIEFIDTYGLDHDGQTISDISERFQQILSLEFKEIDTVIFITPMGEKAPKTNDKFKALIEAKRSLMPHIVYTKLDKFIRENKGDLDALKLDMLVINKYIDYFNNTNINPITDEFSDTLYEYYSKDVADYRKDRIIKGITYFMGVYEEGCNSKVANKYNLHSFVKILLSICRNDNYGIALNTIDESQFRRELETQLMLNAENIDRKLDECFAEMNKILARNYSNSHYNTQNAFDKRIRSNMFGFYSIHLELQTLLNNTFTNIFAKDTGINKDNNLGTLIVNDYFKKNNLNVFIRECINKFGMYLFCVGCCPCDFLLPEKCEMSGFCNNTGATGGKRIRRHRKCSQYNSGAYLYSQNHSVYCTNRGIEGVGLFSSEYGEVHGCINNCFWKRFFSNFSATNKISFDKCLNFDDFKQLFVDFSLNILQVSCENILKFNYLNNIRVPDNTDELQSVPYETIAETDKTYILLTEGITDKLHVELAWSKLYDSDAPFEVFDMKGVNNIEMFLRSYPTDMFRNKVMIGMFDYDFTGLRIYNKFEGHNNKSEQRFIKKIITKNNDINDKEYFVIALPNENEHIINYANGTIEMLYDSDVLNKFGIIKKRNFNAINQLEYVKSNQLTLNAKDYEKIQTTELQYFEPIEDKKRTFCENLLYEDKGVFKGFNELFSIINDIIKQEIR